jgi:phenylalanyl-tRNA synthetase beta chain
MGRDRKHASIGVYDLGAVEGPDFVYRSVGPEELRFTPLGYPPGQALTPGAILAEHPKGKAYARLLAGMSRYPLLADARGRVLSLPPIINSEETRVRGTTRDFFIDVTGSEERIVGRTLNVLVTSLAELDPRAVLEQVAIVYPGRTVATPDLAPQRVELDPERAARRIGVELTRDDVVRHLRQMGHAVEDRGAAPLVLGSRQHAPGPAGAAPLVVGVPAYRNDIMHAVDLIEDVAIAYGYHNIEPTLVPTLTVGGEQPLEAAAEVARRALAGLGFYETVTLVLTSPEQNYDALCLPRGEDCVVIENPISVEQTMVRTTLLAGLLDTLSINTTAPLPQRIFEVGNATLLDAAAETGARERRLVAAAAIGPRVDYAAIRSACEALLRELGFGLAVEPDPAPCFIAGRGARVIAVRDGERRAVGRLGELHPQVIVSHKLAHPVSAFEVDLEALARSR